MKSIVIFILFSFFSLSHSQVKYFVNNDGTGNFSSIAQVNALSLLPGDTVCFQSGQNFADDILNCKKGVTYITYGGSAKAIIGDSLSNLVETTTIQINVEDVILNNLKIYGFKNARKVISYTKGGLIVNNCEIVGGKNAHSKSTIGIKCDQDGITKQIFIRNNIIRDLYKGIYVKQPYNVDIGYNEIYNMYGYSGYYGTGGDCIQVNNGDELTDAFDSKYTFRIHHNNLYKYEHTAMCVGCVSRVLVEYNEIHHNLDERLFWGGMKNGGVGKFFDNTDQTTGSVGNIFRYNYVHNLHKFAKRGYIYSHPTPEQIEAGLILSTENSVINALPVFINGYNNGNDYIQNGGNALSGLGYANIWVHNNIFYNMGQGILNRGYNHVHGSPNGANVQFRNDLGSYLINNTMIDVGSATQVTDDYGAIFIEVEAESPHTTVNNIIYFNCSSSRASSRYKENSASVDYNIYLTNSGTSTTIPPLASALATWFQYSINNANGTKEKYLTNPNWVDTSSTYFVANIGVNGVNIPDVRILSGGNAHNTGMVYNLIGDTYTDSYSTHVLGRDPTGRSSAYDILGNFRTTNDIGAVSVANSSSPLSPIGLKVILEAPYEDGKMKTTLSALNLLPIQQPYNISPWNIQDTSVLNNADSIYVDWVLVQLRMDSNTTSYSKTAILTDKEYIVNADGSSFSFSGILNGDYYIVIRHRNHLAVMSAQKVRIENSKKVEYDFTIAQSKAFGENAMTYLGDGKYGMISGDGDANGVINVLDFGMVANNIPFVGYAQGDLDMNGVLDTLDYSKINQNIFRYSHLP